jgi:CRISPR-associated protein Csa3
LPFTVAVLTHTPSIDTALAFSDIDGKVREWELPVLTADIPNSARDTLALIADAEDNISIPELTEQTQHAKSTVTRHVSQLEESGVVTTKQQGKTKYTELSFAGRLLLRAQQTPDEAYVG